MQAHAFLKGPFMPSKELHERFTRPTVKHEDRFTPHQHAVPAQTHGCGART